MIDQETLSRLRVNEKTPQGKPKNYVDPEGGQTYSRWQVEEARKANRKHMASSIDELVAQGEQAIGAAQTQAKKKGPGGKAAPPGPSREEQESRAARDARKAAIGMMFAVTGKVVFNNMLKLEPEFSAEQGNVLAEGWLPVLDSYAQSPLGVALTITGGVVTPYLLQLVLRVQQRRAEQLGADANGRPVPPREVAVQ